MDTSKIPGNYMQEVERQLLLCAYPATDYDQTTYCQLVNTQIREVLARYYPKTKVVRRQTYISPQLWDLIQYKHCVYRMIRHFLRNRHSYTLAPILRHGTLL